MTTRIRLTRAIIASVAASVLLMPDVTIVAGQAPGASSGVTSDKGAVIGTGTFTGFVQNMDRSLAFYRDAFGMDVPPLPKGVEREPHRMRIQDRGAARLQLRAQNIDALVAAMKDAGLTVVSEGGTAVPIPPNFKGALVADPNNFFLTPFAPCDGCASGPVSQAR